MKRLFSVMITIFLMLSIFSGCNKTSTIEQERDRDNDTVESKGLTNDTIVAALNEWQGDDFTPIAPAQSVTKGNVTTYIYQYANDTCSCFVNETNGVVSSISVTVMPSYVIKAFPGMSADEAEIMCLVLATLPISLVHYPNEETTALPMLLLDNGYTYNDCFLSSVKNGNWEYSLTKSDVVISVIATDTTVEPQVGT